MRKNKIRKIILSMLLVPVFSCSLTGCSVDYFSKNTEVTEATTEAALVSKITISDEDVYVEPTTEATTETNTGNDPMDPYTEKQDLSLCYRITNYEIIGNYAILTFEKSDESFACYIEDKELAEAIYAIRNDYLFIPAPIALDNKDIASAYVNAKANQTLNLTDTTLYHLANVSIYQNNGSLYKQELKTMEDFIGINEDEFLAEETTTETTETTETTSEETTQAE